MKKSLMFMMFGSILINSAYSHDIPGSMSASSHTSLSATRIIKPIVASMVFLLSSKEVSAIKESLSFVEGGEDASNVAPLSEFPEFEGRFSWLDSAPRWEETAHSTCVGYYDKLGKKYNQKLEKWRNLEECGRDLTFNFLSKASLADDRDGAVAKFKLAPMLYDGNKRLGIPSDHEKALSLYTSAAELGLAEAQYTLGQIYQMGEFGVEPDDDLAKEWFDKAKAQGYEM